MFRPNSRDPSTHRHHSRSLSTPDSPSSLTRSRLLDASQNKLNSSSSNLMYNQNSQAYSTFQYPSDQDMNRSENDSMGALLTSTVSITNKQKPLMYLKQDPSVVQTTSSSHAGSRIPTMRTRTKSSSISSPFLEDGEVQMGSYSTTEMPSSSLPIHKLQQRHSNISSSFRSNSNRGSITHMKQISSSVNGIGKGVGNSKLTGIRHMNNNVLFAKDNQIISEQISNQMENSGNNNNHELVNHQASLLLSQSEEIQELKTSKKALEYEKQQFFDKINDLNTKINKLEHEAELKKANFEHEIELTTVKMESQHKAEVSRLENQFKDHLNKITNEHNETIKEMESQHEQELLQLQSTLDNKLKAQENDYEEKFEQIRKHFTEILETEEKNMQSQYESQYESYKKDFDNAMKQQEVSFNEKLTEYESKYQEYLNTHQSQKNRISELELELSNNQREMQSLKEEGQLIQKSADHYKSITDSYQRQQMELEQQLSENHTSANDLKQRVTEYQLQLSNMKTKLITEEALRRKLHNQVQDLKGNIRVYCRVRPLLASESDKIDMAFPDKEIDGQQLQIMVPHKTAQGMKTTRTIPFEFDKVFTPTNTNQDIFLEISQLVQSALDGYNVCIFAYGQTGSGKTYTMLSQMDGMIPLAIEQIFKTAEQMKHTGWTYSFTGEFLEIYNESINDLLSSNNNNNNKQETTAKLLIKHNGQEQKTTVEGLTQVQLENPFHVHQLLKQASKNRATAATNANERSSRSHSVFILRLEGSNSITKKQCSGVLNLIDLAGSERIAHSQTVGDRRKETVAINKSLSSLADVIYALGNNYNNNTNNNSPSNWNNNNIIANSNNGSSNGSSYGNGGGGNLTPIGKENNPTNNNNNNGGNGTTTTNNNHVPYRNSKLTHLLQYSLSGSSKTLMLVNVSSCKQHENETISSLRFATNVNHTRMGR